MVDRAVLIARSVRMINRVELALVVSVAGLPCFLLCSRENSLVSGRCYQRDHSVTVLRLINRSEPDVVQSLVTQDGRGLPTVEWYRR